jgi:hypothetical protein
MSSRRAFAVAGVFAAIISLFAGCKTLEATDPAAANLADAESAWLEIEPNVRFSSLDGHPVPGIPEVEGPGGSRAPRTARSNPDKRIVRIAPGTHRVIAGYAAYSDSGQASGVSTQYGGSSEDEEVEFTALAGKRYFVHLDVSGDLHSNVLWNATICAQGPLGLPTKSISHSLRRIDHVTGAPVPPDQQMRPKRAYKQTYQ